MTLIEKLRERRPVVHCITNYITAGDCANALLAAGASPMMTDDPEEVEDVDKIADALYLNLGTWSRARERAMTISCKTARNRGIPAALDPVGIGASTVRLKTARALISDIGVDVIRGNASEIMTLAGHGVRDGIDAGAYSVGSIVAAARTLAMTSRAVVAATGPVDIVTDGVTVYAVHGGSEMMKYVTGVGCRLTAMCAAFASVSGGDSLYAVLYAVAVMNACGQLAESRLKQSDGSGSFGVYLHDAIYNITEKTVKELTNYEILP